MRLPSVIVPVFIEQQDVNVTCRLNRTTARRDHVAANETVHSANADGAQQTADGGGNQADQQRN